MLAYFGLSEQVSKDPDIEQFAWLVHCGHSEAFVETLTPEIRHGLMVIHARFEGTEFDYKTRRWKKAKS